MNDKIKIILADDDSILRKITAKNLRGCGFEVIEAVNGVEAVELSTQEKPEIAILDIMMPKLSGIDACRLIKEHPKTKHTYILFLTAKDNIRDIISGLSDEKADDYITKPFNMHELIARVEAGARIKKLQNKLEEQNIKLKASLDAQARFLGLAAHDLRSPLAIINTYMSLIGKDIIPIDEIKDTCIRRAEGMMQLIDDVLDITKINCGTVEYNPQKSNIVKTISDTVSLYEPVAENKKINLYLNTKEMTIYCNCDKKRISEIFENLISNAIKYSPENTNVTINIKKEYQYVIIEVIDQGEGILSENISKIFEPFATIESSTQKQVPHTNLGLAIVKKLIELHKGTIEVYSDGIEKGTNFTVKIPINN